MPTSRTATRAATTARTELLNQLKEDHKRVKKAYRDFQKLDVEEDAQACEALVRQVLDELTVHAALEEELLYPAAHGAIADESLVDEAEVEHEGVHRLVDQLRAMTAEDDKYAARFTVLCEYVLHHVKEEEGELFPQLETARLDWEQLATEMNERRQELTAAQQEPGGEAANGGQSDDGEPASATATTDASAGSGRSPKSRTAPAKTARRA